MNGLKSFSIDGMTYRLKTMNPRDAIQFGARVIKAFGPTLAALAAESGNSTEKMMSGLASAVSSLDNTLAAEVFSEALSYCITPQNQELSDEAVFNQWFIDHPDHLFQVAGLAIFHLSKDFFPKTPATKLTSFQTLRAKASMFPFPTDGKSTP